MVGKNSTFYSFLGRENFYHHYDRLVVEHDGARYGSDILLSCQGLKIILKRHRNKDI